MNLNGHSWVLLQRREVPERHLGGQIGGRGMVTKERAKRPQKAASKISSSLTQLGLFIIGICEVIRSLTAVLTMMIN